MSFNGARCLSNHIDSVGTLVEAQNEYLEPKIPRISRGQMGYMKKKLFNKIDVQRLAKE